MLHASKWGADTVFPEAKEDPSPARRPLPRLPVTLCVQQSLVNVGRQRN